MMKLQELKSAWHKEGVSRVMDDALWQKLGRFDDELEQENVKVTWLITGTIFVLGAVVMPFVAEDSILWLIGALFFVLGGHSFALWLRQWTVSQSVLKSPVRFLDSQIRRLQYNLFVTNVLSPLYVVIVGGISTNYLQKILGPHISDALLLGILGMMWLFFMTVLIVVWRKQRAKDKVVVRPQIDDLRAAREEYIVV